MAKRKTKKELITAAVEESFDAFAYLIDQADSDLDKLNAEFVKHGFRVEVNVCEVEVVNPSKSKAPSQEAKEWNDSFRRNAADDVACKIASKDMEFIKPDAVYCADIGELTKETSADLIKSMSTPIGLVQ